MATIRINGTQRLVSADDDNPPMGTTWRAPPDRHQVRMRNASTASQAVTKSSLATCSTSAYPTTSARRS